MTKDSLLKIIFEIEHIFCPRNIFFKIYVFQNRNKGKYVLSKQSYSEIHKFIILFQEIIFPVKMVVNPCLKGSLIRFRN